MSRDTLTGCLAVSYTHLDVYKRQVFDTRFRKIDPSIPMIKCLQREIGLPYVNFKSIGDYIILVSYFLHLLKTPKTEIKAFIREFEKITDEYKAAVNSKVASIVVHPDLSSKMCIRDRLRAARLPLGPPAIA